ncbi:cell wall protein Iff4p [[Candida] anglica]|uniref:Cell wall protein Iff4p n=1 Tax=[Candida] anglica TaxID=148631 RepID=A0ABP0ECH7_9ASCO
MIIGKKVILQFFFFISQLLGQIITYDAVSYSSATIGALEVQSSSFWSVFSSNGNFVFNGDVHVDGKLYISNDDYATGLSVSFAVKSKIINHGDIVLTTGKGLATSSYNWVLNEFYNLGNIWFDSKSPISSSPSYNIQAPTWINYDGARIHYYFQNNNYAVPTFGQDKTTMTNLGTICLTRANWEQYFGVTGSGCIVVGTSTTFTLSNPGSFDESQIIYLTSENSMAYIADNTKTFRIYGLSDQNIIKTSRTINSFQYNPNDGILTIRRGLFFFVTYLRIDVGLGYNPAKFSLTTKGGLFRPNDSIFYRGPAPNGRPANCLPCLPTPNPPISATSRRLPNSYTMPSSSRTLKSLATSKSSDNIEGTSTTPTIVSSIETSSSQPVQTINSKPTSSGIHTSASYSSSKPPETIQTIKSTSSTHDSIFAITSSTTSNIGYASSITKKSTPSTLGYTSTNIYSSSANSIKIEAGISVAQIHKTSVSSSDIQEVTSLSQTSLKYNPAIYPSSTYDLNTTSSIESNAVARTSSNSNSSVNSNAVKSSNSNSSVESSAVARTSSNSNSSVKSNASQSSNSNSSVESSAVRTSNSNSSVASSAVRTSNSNSSVASSAVKPSNSNSSFASSAVRTSNSNSSVESSAVRTSNSNSSVASSAVRTSNSNSSVESNTVRTSNSNSSVASSAVRTSNSNSSVASSAVKPSNSNSSVETSAVRTSNSNSSVESNTVRTSNSNSSVASSAVRTSHSNSSVASSAVRTSNSNSSVKSNASQSSNSNSSVESSAVRTSNSNSSVESSAVRTSNSNSSVASSAVRTSNSNSSVESTAVRTSNSNSSVASSTMRTSNYNSSVESNAVKPTSSNANSPGESNDVAPTSSNSNSSVESSAADPTSSNSNSSVESSAADPTSSNSNSSVESNAADPTSSNSNSSGESSGVAPTSSNSNSSVESNAADPTSSNSNSSVESNDVAPTSSNSNSSVESGVVESTLSYFTILSNTIIKSVGSTPSSPSTWPTIRTRSGRILGDFPDDFTLSVKSPISSEANNNTSTVSPDSRIGATILETTSSKPSPSVTESIVRTPVKTSSVESTDEALETSNLNSSPFEAGSSVAESTIGASLGPNTMSSLNSNSLETTIVGSTSANSKGYTITSTSPRLDFTISDTATEPSVETSLNPESSIAKSDSDTATNNRYTSFTSEMRSSSDVEMSSSTSDAKFHSEVGSSMPNSSASISSIQTDASSTATGTNTSLGSISVSSSKASTEESSILFATTTDGFPEIRTSIVPTPTISIITSSGTSIPSDPVEQTSSWNNDLNPQTTSLVTHMEPTSSIYQYILPTHKTSSWVTDSKYAHLFESRYWNGSLSDFTLSEEAVSPTGVLVSTSSTIEISYEEDRLHGSNTVYTASAITVSGVESIPSIKISSKVANFGSTPDTSDIPSKLFESHDASLAYTNAGVVTSSESVPWIQPSPTSSSCGPNSYDTVISVSSSIPMTTIQNLPNYHEISISESNISQNIYSSESTTMVFVSVGQNNFYPADQPIVESSVSSLKLPISFIFLSLIIVMVL